MCSLCEYVERFLECAHFQKLRSSIKNNTFKTEDMAKYGDPNKAPYNIGLFSRDGLNCFLISIVCCWLYRQYDLISPIIEYMCKKGGNPDLEESTGWSVRKFLQSHLPSHVKHIPVSSLKNICVTKIRSCVHPSPTHSGYKKKCIVCKDYLIFLKLQDYGDTIVQLLTSSPDPNYNLCRHSYGNHGSHGRYPSLFPENIFVWLKSEAAYIHSYDNHGSHGRFKSPPKM